MTTTEQEPSSSAPAAAPAAPFDPATATPEQWQRALSAAWREATDRDTPTLLQLLTLGVERADVDQDAGYVAVVTADETHRAIGVRRELLAPLVAALTGRAVDEVRATLARGPAKIPSAPRTR